MRDKLVVQVKVAVMAGLSLLLMLTLQIPIFPPAPFLTYDLSDVPAMITGFALGPLAGLAVILLKNALFFLFRFGPLELIGVPMNTVAGLTLVGVSSWYYWREKTLKRAAVGIAFGVLAFVAAMIPANYLAYKTLAALTNIDASGSATHYVLAFVTPFNLLKGLLSGTVTFFLYKRISKILKV